MDDISNRTLAILLVTAIVVSLGITVGTLNKLEKGATGWASQKNDTGTVNLTVESAISITLTNAVIDFGIGYVNTSNCPTNATLYAGATYNDSDSTTPDTNCWTDDTAQPTSLILENTGNKNVSVTIAGEKNSSFFEGYTGGGRAGLGWKGRDTVEANSCDSGMANTTWTDFNGTKQLCADFGFNPGDDSLAIDVKIVIPNDLSAGTYKNTSIRFHAEQVA